ncbi:MAG: Tat pathway signal protein [Eggerthellaceae bacterium]|nr:Tat pathway signal protein [Eggerthellaceae bacterium]
MRSGGNGDRKGLGNGETLLTRRNFLLGALGVGAVAAAGAGAVALGKLGKSDDGELQMLSVAEDAVTLSDNLEEIGTSGAVVLLASMTLPYGSLVWSNDDNMGVALIPTETAKPLTQVALLFFGSGSYSVVLPSAVGVDEGFEIYDVRACPNGLVWTEADILDGVWRVYAAPFDGSEVGTPIMLEEGGEDWETPTLAAVGNHAFWQVLPKIGGPSTSKHSLLKRAAFGSASVDVVWSSLGRMSSPPYALNDSVVITPRTNTDTVHHQLTRIHAQTGEIMDTLILPNSMKPLEAGYGRHGFMFSFDGIYNYGGGIANLGTYTPATVVSSQPAQITNVVEFAAGNADSEGNSDAVMDDGSASAGGSGAPFNPGGATTGTATAATTVSPAGNPAYNEAGWFRFSRNPTAAPCWCGKWLMVKSTTAVCGVDIPNNQYFVLDVRSGSDSYGDYLASTGMGNVAVTFSNIDHHPIEGDSTTCCFVRVWGAV